MPWKTPEEHHGESADILDITSRLPILAPVPENTATSEWWSENVVQLTKKSTQEVLAQNEARESERLDTILNWLYFELNDKIGVFNEVYTQLGYIPTDLNAWENDNNRIFIEMKSMEGDIVWILSLIHTISENTWTPMFTRWFLHLDHESSTEKRTRFTIETGSIVINALPKIPHVSCQMMNKFRILFIKKKGASPKPTEVFIEPWLYDEDHNLIQVSEPTAQTTLAEKRITQICYTHAVRTLQAFIDQFKSYTL